MITALDKTTALVLVDLQKGVTKMAQGELILDVLSNAALLVDAFRKESLPIVYVNVVVASGGWMHARKDSPSSRNLALGLAPDFSELVEEVKPLPTDIFVTKGTWNAFYNTQLHEELQKRNVTGIVLGGVSTSAGVEATARAASELGYNISFATDAMLDLNKDAHESSIRNIFPRLGEQGTSVDIIAMLSQRQ